MRQKIINYWRQLQSRERVVLGWGSIFVVSLLFYVLIWQPWHEAIKHLQEALPHERADLVWMRQQAEIISTGGIVQPTAKKGRDQSILAVIEQTAKAAGVRESIKQMVPRANNQEASIVLEEASFSKWLKWVEVLKIQYGVNIKQLSAERETEQPDTAEIRVTFERSG